jgi:pimeloyl-ACP methyl ester carboxylesterase
MLYVQEAGPADAPTILFLHGAGVAGWMWQPQVDDLAQHYHCLVPDLPGHGQSPDASPFTLGNCTAQIADLIRSRAHGGRAHLVGLSMGSSIALQLLAEQPELADHIIVSGPSAGPMPPAYNALTRMMLPFTRYEWMLRQSARSLKLSDELFAAFKQSQQRMTLDILAAIGKEINQFRVPTGLHDVQVLAVVGQKEMKLNYQAAQAVLANVPGAVGRIAPNVGHIWNLENPALFNRMARARLNDTLLPDELLPLEPS